MDLNSAGLKTANNKPALDKIIINEDNESKDFLEIVDLNAVAANKRRTR